MQVLADNGGYVLAEDGERLLFFRRRILPSWAAFVPGVLAVVAAGNGVVQLVVGDLAAGIVLLLVSALAALAWRAVVRSRRRVRTAPLDPSSAVVVVDTAARGLRDGCGAHLAPLDAVRIERAFQATSSARSLRVTWPGGAEVVYRGDALVPGGSIAVAVDALRARGLTVSG
jgi:hypothetical protein